MSCFHKIIIISLLGSWTCHSSENSTEILKSLPENLLDSESFKTATFDVLNKISAKRQSIKINLGSSHVMQDIRLSPQSCYVEKHSFWGTIYRVPIKIYLEQDDASEKEERAGEAIELYDGELSSNPREPQRPLEHSVYDIRVVSCE